MFFLRDLLCLSSGRLDCLDKAYNSIDIIRELLLYYGKELKWASILMWNSTVNAFSNGLIKTDDELLNKDGDVIRLGIMNSGKCIGLLSFTYTNNSVYEVSYFITERFRGKSDISSLLDLVRQLADKHSIDLVARTTDENFKSKHLIEEHLKLTFYGKDNNNNNLFGRSGYSWRKL